MRKRMSSGTATIRVRVSPIGKFTLRSRSPGPWAASLSARRDDLVNVGTVDRHEAGRVETQAGGDVWGPPARDQVSGPRRILGQAAALLAVGSGYRRRLLGGRRGARTRLTRQHAVDEQTRAHVIL